MSQALGLLLLAGMILAYFRAPLWVLVMTTAIVLVWLFTESALNWWQWLLLAAPLAFILTLLCSPSWRIRLFSCHIRRYLAKSLPSISTTEQQALDAGNTGWEKTFFTGRPDWNSLLEQQCQALSASEQAFLDGPVEALCALLHDWPIQQQRDLPESAWHLLREEGFFGLIIPQEYGGHGFSARAHSAVIARLSSRNLSAAVTAMVPNSLGPVELLLRYGTDEQRSQLLPRLASGDDIPCFALTAAEAGSDAAAMQDYGVVARNEQGEIGIRLYWRKRYITLAPVASLLGLAFKLHDPEHLIGDVESLGITLALIPVHSDGVHIGHRHWPMGLAFMNGPTEGHDVWISLDNIIGGQRRIGQGWQMLMECLGNGRGISLPAMAVGGTQKAAFCCAAYARVRKQFHLPIGRFEGVECELARIAGHAYMMNAARDFTVQNMDLGHGSTVASAIIKYHLTERMRLCVNSAMDVHGGKGISFGPGNYLGELYQALPIGITVEGANILTRSLMIFGQGVLRCHPYLLTEMEASRSKDDMAEQRFDRALFAHVGNTISNAVRSLWLGLTHAHFTHVPVAGEAACYCQQVSRISAALALCADVSLMSLGSSFKRREAISARLGDAFSQLYLMAATIKYYHDHQQHKDELPLLRWACDDALWRAQQALDGVLHNLPNRPLAWLLRRLVFPWGLTYSLPEDWLTHQVAANMMIPEVNQRITQHVYCPDAKDEPLRQLADAWHACIQAENAERKLEQAIRNGLLSISLGRDEKQLLAQALEQDILNHDEVTDIQRASTLRRQVIAVDVFDPKQW